MGRNLWTELSVNMERKKEVVCRLNYQITKKTEKKEWDRKLCFKTFIHLQSREEKGGDRRKDAGKISSNFPHYQTHYIYLDIGYKLQLLHNYPIRNLMTTHYIQLKKYKKKNKDNK